jgi:protein-S-isoprenylcysteine O-methyltransferase Ste14
MWTIGSASTPEAIERWLWLVWWASWILAAFWSDRAVKRPGTRHEIVYRLLAMVGAILVLGLDRRQRQAEGILWRTPIGVAWAMDGVVLAGFLFTWWARIHLGRLWSSSVTRKADHHVVDTGPYAIVRHPIYTGITLAAAGTAVLRGTAASWLGVGVMTLGWYVKGRLEERFLRQELGADAYDAYAGRVPMLIPFLTSGIRR